MSSRSEISDREIERGADDYPERLSMLSVPPDRLFVRGSIPQGPMVAIVGSRDADLGMCRFASNLARDLVARGCVVISGGAAGIDTAAHRGALDGGGKTVAVLGAGFDHLYPAENEGLFGEILLSGALVTEFEASAPPTRWTFPRRNRLVAAMASAVVVVQASARSGALITAREAKKLEVPVGAVPSAPGDSKGKGCNGLIRIGASVVEDVSDVVNMLESAPRILQLHLPTMDSRGKETPSKAPSNLTAEEARVFEQLSASPVHIDEIASVARLSAPQTGSAILSLELAGIIEDVGGKCFVRSQ